MRAFCGVRALALLFESLSVSIYVRRYMCVLGVRICVCVLGVHDVLFFCSSRKNRHGRSTVCGEGKGRQVGDSFVPPWLMLKGRSRLLVFSSHACSRPPHRLGVRSLAFAPRGQGVPDVSFVDHDEVANWCANVCGRRVLACSAAAQRLSTGSKQAEPNRTEPNRTER